MKRTTISGQALVTVLFVTVIGMLVTTGAITAVMSAYGSTGINERGAVAYHIAESGAENGVLRLIRNPLYSGETVSFEDGQAVVTVSTVGTDVIVTSIGNMGSVSRKIVVHGHFSDVTFSIDSWKEDVN